jgi:hypothetical protein
MFFCLPDGPRRAINADSKTLLPIRLLAYEVPPPPFMHRLPSNSAVRRIRLAALLLCAKCLVTPVAAGLIAWSSATGDRWLAGIGVSIIVLTAVMVLLQWLIAVRANCPLCMTPVLGNKECAKHRSARTFCGSHRLRVALTVLCLNRFRCPYCGESCEVKARVRRAH